MRSISIFSLSFLSLLLLFGTLFTPGCSKSGKSEPNKPNIIYILIDDLDMSAIKFMPRLQAEFGDKGMTFTNHFVTSSVCCPSRASILSGKYVHNHGVLHQGGDERGSYRAFHRLGIDKSTVATALKAKGYSTSLIGKYFSTYSNLFAGYIPPGWDEWSALLDGPGAFFNYKMSENGKIVTYGKNPEDYQTDVLARKSVDFIQRMASEKKPFFLYLAPYAVHTPLTSAPRHLDVDFTSFKAPRPPSFNEEDVSDKPEWVRTQKKMNEKNIAALDWSFQLRLRMLLSLEEMLDNIIETLKNEGVLDNTYIFFTSDNGLRYGVHRLPGGKLTPYEEDIHVPLVVRGPGVPAGQTVNHFTSNVDFLPTFADIAGVLEPESADGRSLLKVLKGEHPQDSNLRSSLLIEHWPPAIPGNKWPGMGGPMNIPPKYKALRTDIFKYVVYVTDERELYDLRGDPFEMENIYKTANPKLIEQLETRLQEYGSCSGESCRKVDQAPLDAHIDIFLNREDL